jgi:hypothetical protein
MNIRDIHNVILFYIDKEQNGSVTHEEIDIVLDRAQMARFNDLYANPSKFRPDNQSPVVGYGESQRINDALSPFKKTYVFAPGTTPGGVITLPSDYMYLISLSTSVYSNTLQRNITRAVEVNNEEELVLRLESQVCPVSLSGPICIMNGNNQIQLFPDVPQSGKVYYFKRPAVPKFGYTQVGRTITYDSTTSTQLEWKDAEINNIISIALGYLGLNLKSEDLVQFGELKNQQGQ